MRSLRPRGYELVMDFTAFSIIPLAIVVGAAVAVASRWSSALRQRCLSVSIVGSILLSVLLLRPWEVISAAEWPFLMLSLGLLVVWAAGGAVIGMAFAVLLQSAVKLLLQKWGALLSGVLKRGG